MAFEDGVSGAKDETESARLDEYKRWAYGDAGGLARNIFRVAKMGICNNEVFYLAESVSKDWAVLSMTLRLDSDDEGSCREQRMRNISKHTRFEDAQTIGWISSDVYETMAVSVQ